MIFWKQDEFTYPVGEPLFIPNPEGVEEDDGIVICSFVDIRPDQKDFLLFLNKDMTELGRATFDQEIPIAYHGVFLKSSSQVQEIQNYPKKSNSDN
ncbi:unnamed protein product [Allacma fusca]|uniref:Uncharacterized protein n=1 Tax=Allacma fusca TaxID=39272 RepID=A0A8J2PIU4_9HEXA|nr:unnamed protein product [Allacma fusca]